MGYRAVAITEHTGVNIPHWFKDKWGGELNIHVFGPGIYEGDLSTPISYKSERKWHDDIIEDLQKVVGEDKEWRGEKLQMIMMHEDGSVNRINIYADKVVIEAPDSWSTEEDWHQFPGSGV